MNLQLFIIAGILSQFVSATTKLKDLVPICSKSDPKLIECAKNSGQLFIAEMVKGIEDFGIPPIDPINVPFMILSQTDRPLGISLNVTDSQHSGLRNAQIKDLKMDTVNDHLEVELFVPSYSIKGQCDTTGAILLLPVTGHGPCTFSAFNFTMMLTLDGEKVTREGKVYVKSKTYSVKATFTEGKFEAEELFSSNKNLNDVFVRFVNDEKFTLNILNDMKPALEKFWTETISGYMDKLLDNVPNEEFFLP